MALALGACADIRFERSPYAIRAIDMVYSQQEDLTFLVWRLRDSADPSLVSFELYQDGDWRPLELSQAPFPAQPYPCDKYYLCFQYQLPGRYTFPAQVLPLRSIHVDEGLYAGTVPRQQEVGVTFGIAPIGVDNNDSIDPRRLDWFALHDVPLRRGYQWQLVDSRAPYGQGDASVCQAPASSRWATMGEQVKPEAGWVEQPRCMAARPERRDRPAEHVSAPFPPSAVLFGEQQDYLPPEQRPPVLYLYLIDLLIRSDSRCENAKREIRGEIDRRISRQSPDAQRLGTFTPTDTQTGRPTDGCKQRGEQDYPVRQMIETIKLKAAEYEPTPLRVVLVYMNNVELPPSDRVVQQLLAFAFELSQIDNVLPYTWALGSNVIMALELWDATTPWRPIDDEQFFDDLKGWAETNTPFRTMLHHPDTEVIIRQPVLATGRPLRFKLCTTTPSLLSGVGPEPGQTIWSPGDVDYEWPRAGQPHYTIELPSQVLVPNRGFQRVVVSTVVETCHRFCDFPFRAQSGRDLPSWSQAQVCQWAQ